jgi:hypothetical protein
MATKPNNAWNKNLRLILSYKGYMPRTIGNMNLALEPPQIQCWCYIFYCPKYELKLEPEHQIIVNRSRTEEHIYIHISSKIPSQF